MPKCHRGDSHLTVTTALWCLCFNNEANHCKSIAQFSEYHIKLNFFFHIFYLMVLFFLTVIPNFVDNFEKKSILFRLAYLD